MRYVTYALIIFTIFPCFSSTFFDEEKSFGVIDFETHTRNLESILPAYQIRAREELYKIKMELSNSCKAEPIRIYHDGGPYSIEQIIQVQQDQLNQGVFSSEIIIVVNYNRVELHTTDISLTATSCNVRIIEVFFDVTGLENEEAI